MCALGVARHIELAAQLALSGVGHKGRVARVVECEEPALLTSLFCCESSRLACRLWQSVELCLVGYVQRERLVLLQQVLRELQREQTCLFREVAQALLTLVVEQRTATHEAVVAVVEQHLLLGSQLAVVLVHVLDALEETLVQLHVVGVLCEYWAHLLRQSVELIISLGAEHTREYGRHAREQVVVILAVLVVDTHDGVLKSGSFGVVHELLYLLVIAAYALKKSLLVVANLDAVERNGVVWGVIRFKKRILALRLCSVIL